MPHGSSTGTSPHLHYRAVGLPLLRAAAEPKVREAARRNAVKQKTEPRIGSCVTKTTSEGRKAEEKGVTQ